MIERRCTSILALFFCLLVLLSPAQAQPPDFSASWAAEEAKKRPAGDEAKGARAPHMQALKRAQRGNLLGLGAFGAVIDEGDGTVSKYSCLNCVEPQQAYTLISAACKEQQLSRLLGEAGIALPSLQPNFEIVHLEGYAFLRLRMPRVLPLLPWIDWGPAPLEPGGLLRQGLEDLARQLYALHGRQILHGDLRPENLGITEQGRFSLLDWGGAAWQLPAHGPTIPMAYQPPDAMHQHPSVRSGNLARLLSAVKADESWTLGVTLMELLRGDYLFDEQGSMQEAFDELMHRFALDAREGSRLLQADKEQVLRRLRARRVERWLGEAGVSPEQQETVHRLLNLDWTQRLTMEELLTALQVRDLPRIETLPLPPVAPFTADYLDERKEAFLMIRALFKKQIESDPVAAAIYQDAMSLFAAFFPHYLELKKPWSRLSADEVYWLAASSFNLLTGFHRYPHSLGLSHSPSSQKLLLQLLEAVQGNLQVGNARYQSFNFILTLPAAKQLEALLWLADLELNEPGLTVAERQRRFTLHFARKSRFAAPSAASSQRRQPQVAAPAPRFAGPRLAPAAAAAAQPGAAPGSPPPAPRLRAAASSSSLSP